MFDNISVNTLIKISLSLASIISLSVFVAFKIYNKNSKVTIIGKSKNNIIGNDVNGNISITDVTKEE